MAAVQRPIACTGYTTLPSSISRYLFTPYSFADLVLTLGIHHTENVRGPPMSRAGRHRHSWSAHLQPFPINTTSFARENAQAAESLRRRGLWQNIKEALSGERSHHFEHRLHSFLLSSMMTGHACACDCTLTVSESTVSALCKVPNKYSSAGMQIYVNCRGASCASASGRCKGCAGRPARRAAEGGGSRAHAARVSSSAELH